MKYKIIKIFAKQIYLTVVYFISNYCIPISNFRGKLLGILHPDFNFEKNIKIRKNITFYGGGENKGSLVIKENTFLNEECFLDYLSKVIIGKNVAMGMRTMILSSSHKIGGEVRCGKTVKKTTTIGDNCWIGAGVLIYPGIVIGKGVIVSAGEIVRNDIPSNKILKDGKLTEIRNKNKKNSNSHK